MITIPKYLPVRGPYRRDISWLNLILSMLAHAAIGIVLAVSVVGMTGAFDEAKSCITCAGAVR